MIAVVSPAKTLDYETPHGVVEATMPRFLSETETLVEKLRPMSAKKISELMKVSSTLAELNRQRYQDWSPTFTEANSRPALFAFKGDVYLGLDTGSLSAGDREQAQKRLRVLSGLYGLLRPFDRMQPYRLEMGTKLQIRKAKNLYQFWGSRITEALNADLAEQGHDVLVNLASNEYFSSVKPKELKASIITPVFKDWKNGTYKIISFHAKKARGMMARHLIQNQVDDIAGIKDFSAGGYAYDAESSTDANLVFLRKP